MLSFAQSTVVKNKYEGLDVSPHEWIQWRAFIETISHFDYAFSFCFYFHLDLILFLILINCDVL